jgi:hypothetical protein
MSAKLQLRGVSIKIAEQAYSLFGVGVLFCFVFEDSMNVNYI